MHKVAYEGHASVANFGPGFDSIGCAQTNPRGDIVEGTRAHGFKGVRLTEIVNESGLPSLDLSFGPNNVVQAVGQKIFDAANEEGGIQLRLIKRMKIGTGLGSSASSSVAAASTTNDLLGRPFNRDSQQMLEAIVHGEAVATKGLGHADNVLPALLGGFVFIYNQSTYSYMRFKGGNRFYFAIVSPDIVSDTGDMRRALSRAPYDIKALVQFTAIMLGDYLVYGKFGNLPPDLNKLAKEGGDPNRVTQYLQGAQLVMEGIKTNDPRALGLGATMDRIVTPVRAEFITGFYDVRDAALGADAYGFTIAGSGPSVIAITDSMSKAHNLGEAMQMAFERNGVKSVVYVSQINNEGAKRT